MADGSGTGDWALASPAGWPKTALFLICDENDGWFDHAPGRGIRGRRMFSLREIPGRPPWASGFLV
jgi:hypothetical protein